MKVGKEILALSEGLFAHAVDFALWLSVYPVAVSMMGGNRPGMSSPAIKETDKFLEEINYRTIKNAIISAKKQLFMKTIHRNAPAQITEAGRSRLRAIIPVYDQKRVWDGRLHLVTYDIPEKKRKDRNALRTRLIRLGCAKLQESVWLTPYDPIDSLRDLIRESGLDGTVIVSNLGTNASVGEEDVLSLLIRIYDLEALNTRYKSWLSRFSSGAIDQYAIILYLSILKDDPQLPFALLPKWWKGDRAYQQVKPFIRKLSF